MRIQLVSSHSDGEQIGLTAAAVLGSWVRCDALRVAAMQRAASCLNRSILDTVTLSSLSVSSDESIGLGVGVK